MPRIWRRRNGLKGTISILNNNFGFKINSVFFSDPNDESEKILPIELPPTSYEAGQKCVVSGWGKTRAVSSTINNYSFNFLTHNLFQTRPFTEIHGSTVNWLKYTNLTITSFHKCVRKYLPYHITLSPGSLCAWARGTDACPVRYSLFRSLKYRFRIFYSLNL